MWLRFFPTRYPKCVLRSLMSNPVEVDWDLGLNCPIPVEGLERKNRIAVTCSLGTSCSLNYLDSAGPRERRRVTLTRWFECYWCINPSREGLGMIGYREIVFYLLRLREDEWNVLGQRNRCKDAKLRVFHWPPKTGEGANKQVQRTL